MSRPLSVIAAEIADVERAWHALRGVTNGGLAGDRPGGDGAAGAGLPVVGRDGGGNPNHDPATGQFTSAGGSSGKGDRRRRRKRRLRHILRKHRRAHREMTARHGAEKAGLVARQRERRTRHRQSYDRQEARLKAGHAKELASMDARHVRERIRGEKGLASLHAENDRHHAAGRISAEAHAARKARLDEVPAELEASRRNERETRVDWHQGELNNLRAEREHYGSEMQTHQRRQRHAMGRRHQDERVQAKDELNDELAAHGFRRKGASRGLDELDGGRGAGVRRGQPVRELAVGSRRLGASRTHKAGSAESILRHCLRTLGLSAAYRHDELSDRQALDLLEAVRQYGRAWLRHEAEQLIRVYGRVVDYAHGIEGLPEGLPRRLDGDHGQGAGADHPGGDCEGIGVAGGMDGVSRALGGSMRHHVGRFFDRARGFVRELILAGAMALSGPDLTPDDLAEADRQHAVQVAYLDNFERDVNARPPVELTEPGSLPVPGPMTAAEMAARAEMYGGSPWGAALEIERKGVIRTTGAVRERRFHWRELDHPCQTCAAESAKGWVPIGTLLKIGDSECMGIMCDCYFVYEMPDGTNFITRRGWSKAA